MYQARDLTFKPTTVRTRRSSENTWLPRTAWLCVFRFSRRRAVETMFHDISFWFADLLLQVGTIFRDLDLIIWQVWQDRLHCKQEDFLEPKSVASFPRLRWDSRPWSSSSKRCCFALSEVRASEQDLQWLNDTVVWECSGLSLTRWSSSIARQAR